MANKKHPRTTEEKVAIALKSSTYLLGFLAVTSVVVGSMYLSLNEKSKNIEHFLEQNKNVEEVFLERQESYIQTDKEIIEHVANIRPSDDIDYVRFISQLEFISENLGLDTTIQSSEGGKVKNSKV